MCFAMSFVSFVNFVCRAGLRNFICHAELARFVRDSRDLALLPRSGEFFLSRAGGAGEDAQYFVFLHDDELFAINLDFRTGVFAEQDAVAFFYGQREGLTFVVGAAFAGGDDFALLWLILGRVRDDDAPTCGGGFLNPADQDAVV